METDIKRINFFDGLFLRQGEFQAEQLYHLHMRRRLNYILFDGSGVVQVEKDDLLITSTTTPPSATDKTFHVSPGMAISRRDDLREGREIILTTNSPTFDLSAAGFKAGEEAFVAIHYTENQIDLQSVAPNTPTKVEESATVTLHRAWPTTPAPGGENYIRLGKVAFNTMEVDFGPSQRQTAKLRGSLIGSVVTPPIGAPIITSLSPSPFEGVQGKTVEVALGGTNLAGAKAAISGAEDILVVSDPTSTEILLKFQLVIDAAAATDSRTITVRNSTGTTTVTTKFQVNSSTPAPILLHDIPNTNTKELEPLLGHAEDHFSIFGRNLGIGSPTLTSVHLVDTTTSLVKVIHTFVVSGITKRTEPGVDNFDVIDAKVGTFAGAIAIGGHVRVTTGGLSVTSTDSFTILPTE